MAIQSYQDLEVWKCAMDLAEQYYLVTSKFPFDEHFGLTSLTTRIGQMLCRLSQALKTRR